MKSFLECLVEAFAAIMIVLIGFLIIASLFVPAILAVSISHWFACTYIIILPLDYACLSWLFEDGSL
jgi:hypothetical protein